MTAVEFAKAFLALAVVFNEDTAAPAFDVKRDIYWRIFQAWPAERFQGTCEAWITTGRFFPKPAELLEQGRLLKQAAQPIHVALPRQEETPEDQVARETAMAAIKKLFEEDTPTTRSRANVGSVRGRDPGHHPARPVGWRACPQCGHDRPGRHAAALGAVRGLSVGVLLTRFSSDKRPSVFLEFLELEDAQALQTSAQGA